MNLPQDKNGKYIIRLDASALKESSCLLRLINISVLGIKETLTYNDTQYGSAFHTFISELHKTGGNFAEAQLKAVEMNERPSTTRGVKSHLSSAHLVKTCIDFTKHFQENDQFEILSLDGKPLVEERFEISYYEDSTFAVYLCGTIDAIGKFRGGVYAIRDYKTKGLWANKLANGDDRWIKAEISKYFQQYSMSIQLRFYLYCIKLIGSMQSDTPLGKLFNDNIFGLFIEGIFTSSKEPTRFAKSDVFILKQEDLDEFKNVLDDLIERFIKRIHLGDFDTRDGIISGSCFENKYACKYLASCNAPTPITRKMVLNDATKYKVETYDPRKHGT
jgi:hypothetical protein